MQRFLQSFSRAVETVAAVLLGAVMLLVVVSTLSRYTIALPVPDSFDLSRLLLGACLAWGFAVVALRGGHIQVDILASVVGPRLRRVIDVFAWGLLLVFSGLVTWKMLERVLSARRSGETTFDLSLPQWPFFALVWLGIAMSVVMAAIKLVRIATGRDVLDSAEAQELKEVIHGER